MHPTALTFVHVDLSLSASISQEKNVVKVPNTRRAFETPGLSDQ